MRMFTKIGVTLATGAVPVLLWAGTAGAQQSQSQSQPQQSQLQNPTAPGGPSFDAGAGTRGDNTATRGGNLANTGAEDLLPLVLGGAALGGALAVRRGLRHRSAA